MKEISTSLKEHDKVESDYKFDEKVIVSKQKWLKIILQKAVMDHSVTYHLIHLAIISFSNTKENSTPWEILSNFGTSL